MILILLIKLQILVELVSRVWIDWAIFITTMHHNSFARECFKNTNGGWSLGMRSELNHAQTQKVNISTLCSSYPHTNSQKRWKFLFSPSSLFYLWHPHLPLCSPIQQVSNLLWRKMVWLTSRGPREPRKTSSLSEWMEGKVVFSFSAQIQQWYIGPCCSVLCFMHHFCCPWMP